MRKDEPNIAIPPVAIEYEMVDYIYSNSMRSRSLYKGERVVWSLAKTPEAALKWAGVRGKGLYNRLAVYNFSRDDGEFYDLTSLETWIALIHKNKNGTIINNINGYKKCPVEAVRSIIPCMNSAMSLSIGCEEVAFIPYKPIEFAIVEDYKSIIENCTGVESVLTKLEYCNSTIDALIEQLDKYDIKRKTIVKGQLEALKQAA